MVVGDRHLQLGGPLPAQGSTLRKTAFSLLTTGPPGELVVTLSREKAAVTGSADALEATEENEKVM